MPTDIAGTATANDASILVQSRPSVATATATAQDATVTTVDGSTSGGGGGDRRGVGRVHIAIPKPVVDVPAGAALATASAHDATIRIDYTRRLLLEIADFSPIEEGTL